MKEELIKRLEQAKVSREAARLTLAKWMGACEYLESLIAEMDKPEQPS